MWHKCQRLLVRMFYRPWCLFIISRDRYYSKYGLKLLIKKGVFHPGLFYSTLFLLDELELETISGKTLLELGAGSGLISFRAAQRGAVVTATDISPLAIEGLTYNLAQLNKSHSLQITILESDLFNHVPDQPYDYILINPPYYAKDPASDTERAWYCGADYEYFKKMFSSLPDRIQPTAKVWMSMSEDCHIARIASIAHLHKLRLELKSTRYYMGERNMIFQICQEEKTCDG